LAPIEGRFADRDPLGFVDGLSLYGAYFSPSSTDPTGTVIQKCKCSTYVTLATHGGASSTTSSWTVFTDNPSCQIACCGSRSGCKGSPVTPSADETSAMALCSSLPAGIQKIDCEKSISDLMNKVRKTTSGVSVFWVPEDDGYCFSWLKRFKCQYTGWDDDGTLDLPGGCTIELLEFHVHEELVDPYWNRVITAYSLGGWGPPFGFKDHGVVRVCCGTGAARRCMYFDVGVESYTGQIGGEDKWFGPNDPDFIGTLDCETERKFR